MGRFLAVTKRKRSAESGLFALVAALALAWALGQGRPSLDGSLQAMESSERLSLSPGEELLRADRDGDLWVEAIRAPTPVALPDDATFRAELRARCDHRRLAPLLRGGGTAIEHRHGPDGALVYTLRMNAAICEQVRMG